MLVVFSDLNDSMIPCRNDRHLRCCTEAQLPGLSQGASQISIVHLVHGESLLTQYWVVLSYVAVHSVCSAIARDLGIKCGHLTERK